MNVQDYSAFLTPEQLAIEEELWEQVAIYRLYADKVAGLLGRIDRTSVVELGCGTGWVPTALPTHIDYTGVDSHPGCLELACQKTPYRFIQADIRTLTPATVGHADVVCSFAVLKHFAMHEWADIVRTVLSLAPVGLFTMNVGPHDTDDFAPGFPHTWVTVRTLTAAVEVAGHVIDSKELLYTGEMLVETHRV